LWGRDNEWIDFFGFGEETSEYFLYLICDFLRNGEYALSSAFNLSNRFFG
jgi:hypothetical protein